MKNKKQRYKAGSMSGSDSRRDSKSGTMRKCSSNSGIRFIAWSQSRHMYWSVSGYKFNPLPWSISGYEVY